MRRLVSLLVMLALVYTGTAGVIYLFQGKLVYYPTDLLVSTPRDAGLNYEDVHIKTADNVTIHGWFIAAPEARATLLFFHGNAGNISHRLDTLAIFNMLGLSSFIIDYRGYGRSEGNIDEQGTYLDARAAWDYLVNERGIPADQIILFGRSLGGAVAANLASQVKPRGLILESSFTSVPDLAADHYPWLPVRLMSRIHYDTFSLLHQLNMPLLVIHSPHDEIIPFHHAIDIMQGPGKNKTLLEIRGSHNHGFLRTGAEYRQGLSEFIDGLQTTPVSARAP